MRIVLVALALLLWLGPVRSWIVAFSGNGLFALKTRAPLKIGATTIARAQSTSTSSSEQQTSFSTTAVIGAGWAGLAAAHALSRSSESTKVLLLEASPSVGGLVRDGFSAVNASRPAEAGQHGFWDNYHNIFRLINHEIEGLDDTVLTAYAEQGQYSPRGLEAVWPVYRDQSPQLPTGLAQAAYTKFLSLPWLDRATAVPLVLAFSEFDGSDESWRKYDSISFRDLCLKLGVSQRCYDEAFEPMILTGLFAPGNQCSAAAALGMAYFFVLQSQTAFDVRWCRGNIGDLIFKPWIEQLRTNERVQVECSTRVTGFDINQAKGNSKVRAVHCQRGENGSNITYAVDNVIFAVGASALKNFARFCPELSQFPDFRGFANLRGTSVLATRIFLDQIVPVKYSANACWGFDEGVGMTLFDIRQLHGNSSTTVAGAPGAVLEVDYYHANSLLVLDDEAIIQKVKADLNTLLGCTDATVVDAAVIRLPQAVNWYFPGSWKDQPRLRSPSLSNVFFAGDIVHTDHGSWSQEKAFVTGLQAANVILGRPKDEDVLPVSRDESHVVFGRNLVNMLQNAPVIGTPPSLANFWR